MSNCCLSADAVPHCSSWFAQIHRLALLPTADIDVPLIVKFATGMAAASAAILRHPGRRLLPFSQAQRNVLPVPGRCSRFRPQAAAVAAARKAAPAVDAADTVADGSAADADEAGGAPKRGRPRKAAQADQMAASAGVAAASKPRGRSKKDAAAVGNGAAAAAEKKHKTPHKKQPAEDTAVKNLKLSFDQDQVEEQMVSACA